MFVYCGLGELLAKANGALEQAIAEEAEELAERASANAAVDTGTLSGGIQAQTNGKTATVSATAETHPGQALAQEVGSVHNPATQYMEQAAIESSGSLPQRIAAVSHKVF